LLFVLFLLAIALIRCTGRVSSSCSICGTCHVTLVTNPVISHERGKDRIVITTSGTYLWSFVTQILCNGKSSHGDSWSNIPELVVPIRISLTEGCC
jgi:hypothetical protein